jgi:hypothetical protein
VFLTFANYHRETLAGAGRFGGGFYRHPGDQIFTASSL